VVGKRFDVRFASFLMAVLLLAILLPGCAANNASSPRAPVPAPQTGNQPLVSPQPITWTSDGIVADNEYTQFQQFGSLQVFSRVEGSQIYMALRAQNNGYIALGIRPEEKMKGADDIVCAITGNQATITDAYSTGQFGPHPADTELGGTNDILKPSGSQANGWETFEFQRKLVTGDSKDKELAIGDNPVIWSVGGSSDITVHHNNRGYATLTLK